MRAAPGARPAGSLEPEGQTAVSTSTLTMSRVGDSVSDASVSAQLAATGTSGWSPDASERRDFYHRPRTFPASVRRWRQALVEQVLEEPERFPLARGTTKVEARSLVDEGISFLREVPLCQ